jgi:uncharacterized protein DUF4440
VASEAIEAFFRQFEERSAAGDVSGLVALFAPSFLMAGPAGTQVVKASDMTQVIPRRKQMFDAAGCRSTSLRSVEETPLDGRYSLVRTEWQWTFDRPDGGSADLTLPSSFIVERADEGARIVCYIMHADVAAILRERGLLPS